MYCFYRRLY